MPHAIATIDSGPLTKVQVVAQKRLIQEVMQSVMIGPTDKNPAGTHYGIIPGCKLPSLYKAGSEVILSTFRIAVNPIVEDLSTRDCFRYRVTCQGILPSGEIVGAGIGEASTDEEKYMWRGAVCPEEFEHAPEDRRRLKWQKGWNNAPAKSVQQVRTNPADLANTVLKMAKKRAQIDLTLTATGASDCFSQDLEDLPAEILDELTKENGTQPQGKPSVASPGAKTAAATTSTASTGNGKLATDGQVKMLALKLKNAGITKEAFCAHFKIGALEALPMSDVNPALKLIGENGIAEIGTVTEPAAAAETEKTPDAAAEPVDMVQCKNCGEQINPANNTGHLADCSYVVAE